MKNKWIIGTIAIGLAITSCESRKTILERRNRQINDSIRVVDSLNKIQFREDNIKAVFIDSMNYVNSHEKAYKFYFDGWNSLATREHSSHQATITEAEDRFIVDLGFKTIYGPRILVYKKVRRLSYPFPNVIITEVYETNYPQVHINFIQGVSDDMNFQAKIIGLWSVGYSYKHESVMIDIEDKGVKTTESGDIVDI